MCKKINRKLNSMSLEGLEFNYYVKVDLPDAYDSFGLQTLENTLHARKEQRARRAIKSRGVVTVNGELLI